MKAMNIIAASLTLFLASALPLPKPLPQEASASEPTLLFPMLRNGDFTIPQKEGLVPGGIPWWLQRGKPSKLHKSLGSTWIFTESEAVAHQPIPGFAPMTDGIIIRGRVRGLGILHVIDGKGRSAQLEVGEKSEVTSFEWTGADIAAQLGSAPMPRMSIELTAAPGKSAAWTDIEFLVPLPCPSEEALRAEILERLHEALDPWLERGLDNFGPRKTGLVVTYFDAVTGEILVKQPGAFHPLIDILFDLVAAEPDPKWVAAVERFIEDYLELLIHPDTGLPRKWNAVEDVPLNDRFQYIHLDLRFLLNVAESGPEKYREKTLAAAERMVESALATGVLPDGNVAALYRPNDGASSNETRPIRRFDAIAQITRLAKMNGDERLLQVARDAVATMLYTNYWSGTWRKIDPGLDDNFGHYAARAVVMATAYPDEPLFRRVVDSGWDLFRVIWPQAMHYGGSMAADQVRCWKLLLDYRELRPDIQPELGAILLEAVHSHLRGQQYGNGAWGDVTYYKYQPAVDLQVGDLPGTPTNLLEGLSFVYGSGLGLEDEQIRAWFTAVLRSSVTRYKREYGYLSTMGEMDGPNHAGGSLRIGPALVMMLSKL
ncbi:MAG: hypothetical protein ACI8X5_002783 [Planctomycetota bacterium]|jgi:hypothetical protein